MYKNILVTLDNSEYSLWGLDYALEMAKTFGSKLVGNHVYASRLHEKRFVQMEPGLPEKFQDPVEMQKQRDIHADLIDKGLQLISDSYLDVFQAKCKAADGVKYSRKTMEGRNFNELVKDVEESSYDLVAIGAKGLGESPNSPLGSVCERVTRKINVDTIIMKKELKLNGGHIVVGVDGSEQSFAAVKAAAAMNKHLGCKVTALAVFDPHFHYKAFDSISKVLSEEAGKVFKFEEQEKLHNEIIDSGLEKIYEDHLNNAIAMAEKMGATIEGHVLAGKPHDAILQWMENKDIALLILGKIGVHSDNDIDIGSNAENLLRNAVCNVMLVSRKEKLADTLDIDETKVEWTEEAQELLKRVPGFVQNMVRGHMEANARKDGLTRITGDMMRETRKKVGM